MNSNTTYKCSYDKDFNIFQALSLNRNSFNVISTNVFVSVKTLNRMKNSGPPKLVPGQLQLVYKL